MDDKDIIKLNIRNISKEPLTYLCSLCGEKNSVWVCSIECVIDSSRMLLGKSFCGDCIHEHKDIETYTKMK